MKLCLTDDIIPNNTLGVFVSMQLPGVNYFVS